MDRTVHVVDLRGVLCAFSYAENARSNSHDAVSYPTMRNETGPDETGDGSDTIPTTIRRHGKR